MENASKETGADPGVAASRDVLVSTQWVRERLDSKNELRLVECNEDRLRYHHGHIPGAVQIHWAEDLNDKRMRDCIQPPDFARLCASRGIGPDTTVVFYGDKANWWACYAFWIFELFGHRDIRIMDGGRDKWIDEGHPWTQDRVAYPEVEYPVPAARRDYTVRAFYADALAQAKMGKPLIDVRSPGEYTGETFHASDFPGESALIGGHIPGARNIPWDNAVRGNGTFKPRAELEKIYLDRNQPPDEDGIIAYCRIGERSAHTWFVLKHLLGLKNVRNYDGSWTEWGNRVRSPVAQGPDPGSL
ncbi:MAG: sulfurtransferase [Opitutales bacterium]|nr:sulfurtransferase [Opitutales bacterium]